MVWATKVEMLPKQLAGVLAASIWSAPSQITIEYLPGIVTPERIRKVLMSWFRALDPELDLRWGLAIIQGIGLAASAIVG